MDEDDLSPQGLSAYSVLYVTEPNIPVEGQQGIGEWVKAGGTWSTVSGTGHGGSLRRAVSRSRRGHSALRKGLGQRLLIADTRALKEAGKGREARPVPGRRRARRRRVPG